MRAWSVAAAAWLAVVGYVEAQSSFSPANPPAAPLAVKSPYLHAWLGEPTGGGSHGSLAGNWPRFWTGQFLGWQGFIMVDGVSYNWMGAAPGPGNVDQVSLEYTSTSTIFTSNVGGKIRLVVKFLSPVYPDDDVMQSIPFSYLEVSVATLDGAPHDVQIYSDISAEWASGDASAIVEWETASNNGIQFHTFWRQDQSDFQEANDQASWGRCYWVTDDDPGLTYRIGQDVQVRGQFLANGALDNSVDTNFRAVNNQWPVFAHSRDLGSVGAANVSVRFSIGLAQQNVILYQGQGDTPQQLPALWAESMTEEQAVVRFHSGYDNAVQYSAKLDQKIQSDSVAAGGQQHATLTTLAFRQVYAGLQLAGPSSNTMVFLKEISSDSDIGTVDVIFPLWPLLMYLRPEWIRFILLPLLINQESGHYPNAWAMHDLGRYPQALGYPSGNDEPMPLEECGDMIIMMLSYAQLTGDTDFLQQYYNLLAQWAQFLIDEAKIPADQLSTDDFLGHAQNQTNLAIKGIIALEAMSHIANLTGNTPAQDYTGIAHRYYNFWNDHGVNHQANPPHSMFQYDQPDTYGLLYNIYPDKALQLNFIPQQLYDDQSRFYMTVQSEFGVKLDTRSTQTKLDWEMWTAAVSNSDTMTMFISKMATWVNATSTRRPLTDLYDVDTGGFPSTLFYARPVVGGLFALLALLHRP